MKILLPALALLAVLAGCAPLPVEIGPPVRAAALEPDRVITPDGEALPLMVVRPDGPARVAVVALHGFNDYARSTWEEPARAWAARGIVTYAYDQRGFGRAPRTGLWVGGSVLAADAGRMLDLVREREPGLPVYLMGESMGGAVAIAALTGPAHARADGVVLSAPAVWGRATMGLLPRAGLAVLARVLPGFKLTGEGLKIKVSDNGALLRRLSRDPLIIKATRVDTVFGLVDLMDEAYADADRIAIPTLLLYGMRDEIVPPEPTCLALDRMWAAHHGKGLRAALYPEGYHMLLRDLEARIVWEDVASWLLDPKNALPSGYEMLNDPSENGFCRKRLEER